MAPSNDPPSSPAATPASHAAAQRSEAAGIAPRNPEPESRNPEPETPTPAVYLETFGCQMNVLDSQLVSAQLRSLGYRFTDSADDADVVLYNTCSVREHAEAKVYSRVGRVGKAKAHKPHVVLGVIGCMAERDGEDMLKRYPQIDLLCGPGELDKLPGMIDNAVRNAPGPALGNRFAAHREQQAALQGDTHRRTGTLAAAEDQLELIDLARSFSPHQEGSAPRSAYVRITRGCNKFCTYCVVPQTRGAEVHRPPRHILDECKRLVDAGVVEITLLGQTVNHYHFDHTKATQVELALCNRRSAPRSKTAAPPSKRHNGLNPPSPPPITGHPSPITTSPASPTSSTASTRKCPPFNVCGSSLPSPVTSATTSSTSSATAPASAGTFTCPCSPAPTACSSS